MTNRKIQTLSLLVVVAAVLLSAGCAKKAAKVTPPAAPPAPATPTATLAVNPSVIQQGQSTTLTWQTSNAVQITIAGLGALPPSGSRTVSPGASTTYTLVAKGPAEARMPRLESTVNQQTAATPSLSDEELFARRVKDVFFDYNMSNPDRRKRRPRNRMRRSSNSTRISTCSSRDIAMTVVPRNTILPLEPAVRNRVKQTLVQQGVPANRIKIISYGKEKPFCTDDNEQCWQQNRVDHFSVAH